ncbi:MAG: sulfotransferase domain-containing protein [Chthoniobacterales bacterium]|nr:sulfotransferase domain-containing protein [Chthoniobacterales bacterium]
MSPIDFIGIGAPKCGTTWLSAQLAAHPQIGFAPDKEVYYFADTTLRRFAGKELNCFARGEDWYHQQFPAASGAITCRGEFCPSYLYSEEAAERIAAYRSDIKLLLCLRPPVEMIYSWYWYNRNAVVATLPATFAEMMEIPFLRDLACFSRHLQPYLSRFPAQNILVIQFHAIRRTPDSVRERVYEFLNVIADFKPKLEAEKNAARAPRFPLLQAGAQKIYEGVSALPGVGKILKSPAVAKNLQSVYHRFNSKARKYEPLLAEERQKWEAYYAADQEELSRQLQGLQVIA